MATHCVPTFARLAVALMSSVCASCRTKARSKPSRAFPTAKLPISHSAVWSGTTMVNCAAVRASLATASYASMGCASLVLPFVTVRSCPLNAPGMLWASRTARRSVGPPSVPGAAPVRRSNTQRTREFAVVAETTVTRRTFAPGAPSTYTAGDPRSSHVPWHPWSTQFGSPDEPSRRCQRLLPLPRTKTCFPSWLRGWLVASMYPAGVEGTSFSFSSGVSGGASRSFQSSGVAPVSHSNSRGIRLPGVVANTNTRASLRVVGTANGREITANGVAADATESHVPVRLGCRTKRSTPRSLPTKAKTEVPATTTQGRGSNCVTPPSFPWSTQPTLLLPSSPTPRDHSLLPATTNTLAKWAQPTAGGRRTATGFDSS